MRSSIEELSAEHESSVNQSKDALRRAKKQNLTIATDEEDDSDRVQIVITAMIEDLKEKEA